MKISHCGRTLKSRVADSAVKLLTPSYILGRSLDFTLQRIEKPVLSFVDDPQNIHTEPRSDKQNKWIWGSIVLSLTLQFLLTCGDDKQSQVPEHYSVVISAQTFAHGREVPPGTVFAHCDGRIFSIIKSLAWSWTPHEEGCSQRH
jgi:hypothetical protein